MFTRRLRSIVRTGIAVAAIALLCLASRYPQAVRTLVGFSPFVVAAGALAAGSAVAIVWWAVLPTASAAIRKRLFCRWLCPTGRCLDLLGAAGTRCGLRAPRVPRVGWWIALAPIGGACFGYPLCLWLDPLALMAAPLTMPRFAGLAPGNSALWCFFLPAAVALIALAAPGRWCARLCPLGGFQEFLHWVVRPGRWLVANVLRHRSAAAEPLTAQTEASENRGDAEGAARGARRRVVLAGVAGAVCGWAMGRRGDSGGERPWCPPGAADERQFTGLCVRCGNCISTCPEKILVVGGALQGWAGLLAPQVRLNAGYCREDCVRCTQACPSGAIRPVKKRDKVRTPIGFPRVDMHVCILGEDGECTACARACPFEAIRYEFCETDYTTVPRIDPDRCHGCGACQVACPTEPKSIVVAGHPRR